MPELETYSEVPYNNKHQEVERIEAFDTGLVRSTKFEWHPDYWLITKIVEEGKETILDYDSSGQLVSKTILPSVEN